MGRNLRGGAVEAHECVHRRRVVKAVHERTLRDPSGAATMTQRQVNARSAESVSATTTYYEGARFAHKKPTSTAGKRIHVQQK